MRGAMPAGLCSLPLTLLSVLGLFTMLASAQVTGGIQFRECGGQMWEPSGLIYFGVSVHRNGGLSEPVSATVKVLVNETTATPGLDYDFAEVNLSFPENDGFMRAIPITIHDDHLWEETEHVTLVLTNIQPPYAGGSEQQKCIISIAGSSAPIGGDGDGGVFQFYDGRLPADENTDPSYSVKTDEKPPGQVECLIRASRIVGSSGSASVWLERVPCDPSRFMEVEMASETLDFLWVEPVVNMTWQDGENDTRCVLASLPYGHPGFSSAGNLLIFPDSQIEKDETLCFTPHVHGSAWRQAAGASGLTVQLMDLGIKGGGVTNCTKGWPCEVDLTLARTEAGVTVFAAADCAETTCAAALDSSSTYWKGTVTPVYTATVDVQVTITATPGYWFVCECLRANSAAPLLPVAVSSVQIEGPESENARSCVVGWPICWLYGIQGQFLQPETDYVRVMPYCPSATTRDASPPGFREGAVAVLDDSGWWSMANPVAMATVGAGVFSLCWCRSTIGGNCSNLNEFNVPSGTFMFEGPFRMSEITVYVGDELTVGITGIGLSSHDMVRVQPTCGVDYDKLMVAHAQLTRVYDFGAVTEEKVSPGIQKLCWCKSSTEYNVSCSQAEEFTTEFATLKVLCDGQRVNMNGHCQSCSFVWLGPNDEKDGCEFSLNNMSAMIVFFIAMTQVLWIIFGQLALVNVKGPDGKTSYRMRGRKIFLEDISSEEQKLVVTCLGAHGLGNHGRSSFAVVFEQTNHYLLDGKTKRALVLDKHRLLLTEQDGSYFKADASVGFCTLSIPGTFFHSRLFSLVPVLVLTPVLMIIAFAMFAVAIPRWTVGLIMFAGEVFLALVLRFIRAQKVTTPLKRRLDQYTAQLVIDFPDPVAVPRGPSRAVTAHRLFDLYDFFMAFIKDRTMYYLSPNIILPLTARHELSFAELVGPQQVQWFISHYWGTPFRDFCESVRRHAVMTCGSADEETWKKVSYWICTFSNNQYRVMEELGTDHKESSFYLALHSGVCKGTAMIMDAEATLLTRSWCLFELLQTIGLEEKQKDFQGLLFCTATGVLNFGHATVEMSMKIGHKITQLSLQDATATVQADKDMINGVVLEEMGSFEAIDQVLRGHLARALKKCQNEVDFKFEDLFTKLKGDGGSPGDGQCDENQQGVAAIARDVRLEVEL